MDDLLSRAATRQQTAESILDEFDLIARWRRFGNPILVGAVAYGLVVAPDIDIEIYCAEPRIEDGFEVLKGCALHPHVSKTRFWNALFPPHHGLYWQVRYIHDSTEWKIDMWSVANSYAGPCGARLVEPMKEALTDEPRAAILRLKEEVLADGTIECPSIQVYRAVLDFHVRTFEELKAWIEENPLKEVVTDWRPR